MFQELEECHAFELLRVCCCSMLLYCTMMLVLVYNVGGCCVQCCWLHVCIALHPPTVLVNTHSTPFSLPHQPPPPSQHPPPLPPPQQQGQADRVNYLMTKQAKIVAMTCTHAALKRREFMQLAFQYDNLLMEESAQILEVETFIPMMLQKQVDGHSRLKRVIMIGDHHQLPPVVKNMAFQKFSHLDQSLFTRFVRLGTPYVELNAQVCVCSVGEEGWVWCVVVLGVCRLRTWCDFG